MKHQNNNNVLIEKMEKDVVDWYVKGKPIRDIIEFHGLRNDQALYTILRKHDIPLRRKAISLSLEPQKIEPVKPSREWYLLEECATITGMETIDIEWLIHKGAVYSDMVNMANGDKLLLVHLPSLVETKEHTGIDGKRAKQLLGEAWVMLTKVSRQKAVNIDDAKWITTAIHDFFVLNGWKIGTE